MTDRNERENGGCNTALASAAEDSPTDWIVTIYVYNMREKLGKLRTEERPFCGNWVDESTLTYSSNPSRAMTAHLRCACARRTE